MCIVVILIEVTTEAAAPVPNGDFEDLRETINIPGIQQGEDFEKLGWGNGKP